MKDYKKNAVAAIIAALTTVILSSEANSQAAETPSFLQGKVEIKEEPPQKNSPWGQANRDVNSSLGVKQPPSRTKNNSGSAITHVPVYESVELEGSDLSVELTDAERILIQRKRNELLKYLYQEQTLAEARELMIDNERQKKKEQEIRNKLDPEEIVEFRRYQQRIEEAQNKPLGQSVELTTRTVDVELGSAKPIDINIAPGYVSSIVFYDQTGSPWTIEGEVIGDKNAFSSTIVSTNQNIASLEILRPFATSNALVVLDGLDIPLVFRLNGNNQAIDSRLTVRIPKFGPNAKVAPFVTDRVDNASPEMISILDGDWSQLNNAKRYKLSGVEGEAYLYNGFLYVRSPHLLLIPASESRLSSPSGYQITKIVPSENLVFSVDGERVYAEVEEVQDVKIRNKKSIFQNN